MSSMVAAPIWGSSMLAQSEFATKPAFAPDERATVGLKAFDCILFGSSGKAAPVAKRVRRAGEMRIR